MKKILLGLFLSSLVLFVSCADAPPVAPGGGGHKEPQSFIIDYKHEVDWSKMPAGMKVQQQYNWLHFSGYYDSKGTYVPAIQIQLEYEDYRTFERASDSLGGRKYYVTSNIVIFSETEPGSRAYKNGPFLFDSLKSTEVNKYRLKTDFSGPWE